MDRRAFQDDIPGNHCWGCGTRNEHGLSIKSYWEGSDGRRSVCTFRPEPHQMALPERILNGGIIATLIDCHCVCTAMAAAYRAEGRDVGSDPVIGYATGSLQVTYLKPTPIDRPVNLQALIVEEGERKTRLSCELFSGEVECARGEVVAVRVPAQWLTSG